MKIPQRPPDETNLFGNLQPDTLVRIFQSLKVRDFDARYLPWDELRFRKPPEGITLQEWWLALKLRRKSGSRGIALKDKTGQPFHFCVPDLVVDLLHQIDRGGGTFVQIPEQITNADQRDRYVIRSLIEESITSSQLEGAATTREVAKKTTWFMGDLMAVRE